MIHFHDGGDPFRSSYPQHRNFRRRWDCISVQRHDLERVPGQRKAPNLRRASIENVKQDTLASLHAHRFAMSQHSAVDREIAVADLVAVPQAFRKRCFHGSFARRFEFFDFSGRRQEILGHVPALAEARLELLQDEEDFAVVPAWFLSRFDVHRPDFSAVLPGSQVGTRAIVCVIEAEPSRARRKHHPPFATCQNKGGAFFGGAVHIDGNLLTVPMQLFRSSRVVVNVDTDLPPFFETKERSGKLPIVSNRRNDSLGRDLNRGGRDVQCVVCTCFILRPQAKGRKRQWKARTGKLYTCKSARASEESAAGNLRYVHKLLFRSTIRCWFTLE